MAKIFIIDDSPEMTDILSNALSDLDHEIHAYNNSELGFQEISRIKPEILFIDLFMPALTGFDIISSLKHLTYDINIVVISGGYEKIDKDTCIDMAQKLGAQYGLTKPFEISDVMEIVNEITSGSDKKILN